MLHLLKKGLASDDAFALMYPAHWPAAAAKVHENFAANIFRAVGPGRCRLSRPTPAVVLFLNGLPLRSPSS